MAKGYSVDLRERVVRAYEQGQGSYREVASQYEIGEASLSRWLRRKRETGKVEALAHGGGYPRQLSLSDEKELYQLVEQHPQATLVSLAEQLCKKLGRSVKVGAVKYALYRMRVTLKKNHPLRRK